MRKINKLLSIALCLAMIMGLAVAAYAAGDVTDISQAVAADKGTFTVKGVVTCVDSSNIYVQDATGAICVRMTEKPTDIALGDTIIGTGTKAVYNGMPQLGSSTYEKSEGGSLSAKETTIDALTTADICTYVKISGLTVTEIYDKDGEFASPNITITDGTNEIQIYKAAVDKNEDGSWALAVGDKIDILAAVGCYKETLQLRNTLASEITKVIENPGDNEDAGDNGDSGNTDDKVEQNPETADATIVAAALLAACAAVGMVVVTKKEQF